MPERMRRASAIDANRDAVQWLLAMLCDLSRS
jgi:hypothetical protein